MRISKWLSMQIFTVVPLKPVADVVGLILMKNVFNCWILCVQGVLKLCCNIQWFNKIGRKQEFSEILKITLKANTFWVMSKKRKIKVQTIMFILSLKNHSKGLFRNFKFSSFRIHCLLSVYYQISIDSCCKRNDYVLCIFTRSK